LSIAPIFLGMFITTSLPYFNSNLAYAISGAFLYGISITFSGASLVKYFIGRRT
jgi:hypothetical protein